jgi:hypothetical protein
VTLRADIFDGIPAFAVRQRILRMADARGNQAQIQRYE